MNDQRPLVFFHAPNSRSSGVLALLEELGADYELRVLNLKNRYLQAVQSRPAMIRARARDAELAAAQA